MSIGPWKISPSSYSEKMRWGRGCEDVKPETSRRLWTTPRGTALLYGPTGPVHLILYEDMDEFLILKAAMLTKEGSGPSVLDANGRRKILTSRSFGTESSDLCKTFALFVKRLCLEKIRNTESLESFIYIDPVR